MESNPLTNIMADQVTITSLADPNTKPLTGAIAGTEKNGILRLVLRSALSEGTAVRLESGHNYVATGRVLYSLPSGNSHYVTIQTEESERRREPRISVAEDAHIVSMEPQRAPINCAACVADVSKSGIGLIGNVYVPKDILLKITLEECMIFGAVRHCSPLAHDANYFKLGVEIETVIFRDVEGQSNWLFTLKSLWSTLTAASQILAKQIRRDWKS